MKPTQIGQMVDIDGLYAHTFRFARIERMMGTVLTIRRSRDHSITFDSTHCNVTVCRLLTVEQERDLAEAVLKFLQSSRQGSI